jgi:hypothetical protein
MTCLVPDVPVTDGYALVEIFHGSSREFVFAVRCGCAQAEEIAAEKIARHQREYRSPLRHHVRMLAAYRVCTPEPVA